MPGNGTAGDLPDWYAPPGMTGGHVIGPAIISRSARLVLAVRQVLAYPVGCEIEIEAHARGTAPGGPPPDPGSLTGYSDLRFRLRLADGTDVRQDDETGLHSGRGPMLVLSRGEHSSGGPDDREDLRLTLWTWPLPPPGTLTLVCSWPRHGLAAADLVLDADAIRDAAGRAEPFWPEQPTELP